MARVQTTHSPGAPTNAADSSALPDCSPAEQAVPASFAEWLAQPAAEITDVTEPEQGFFVGLLDECNRPPSARPPGKSVQQ